MRFHEIDVDGSKTITLEEWLHFYAPPPPVEVVQQQQQQQQKQQAAAAAKDREEREREAAAQRERAARQQQQKEQQKQQLVRSDVKPSQQSRTPDVMELSPSRQNQEQAHGLCVTPRVRMSESVPSGFADQQIQGDPDASPKQKGTLQGSKGEPWQTVALGTTVVDLTNMFIKPKTSVLSGVIGQVRACLG